MSIVSYRPVWTTGGGTGYTVLHHQMNADPSFPNAWANAVRAMFGSFAALMPTDVSVTFPAEMLVLNEVDGSLEQVLPVTAPASVVGTGTTAYAAPVGGRIDWITAGIVAGRRVRGRTFVVPLLAGAYDTDGTIVAGTITAIRDAAALYLTQSNILGTDAAVWSRPLLSNGTIVRSGSSHKITSSLAVDKVAILRGRRD